MVRKCLVRQARYGIGSLWHVLVGYGKAWYGRRGAYLVTLGKSSFGQAGGVRLGKEGQVLAWHGQAGKVRHGPVRHGRTRHGRRG